MSDDEGEKKERIEREKKIVFFRPPRFRDCSQKTVTPNPSRHSPERAEAGSRSRKEQKQRAEGVVLVVVSTIHSLLALLSLETIERKKEKKKETHV